MEVCDPGRSSRKRTGGRSVTAVREVTVQSEGTRYNSEALSLRRVAPAIGRAQAVGKQVHLGGAPPSMAALVSPLPNLRSRVRSGSRVIGPVRILFVGLRCSHVTCHSHL